MNDRRLNDIHDNLLDNEYDYFEDIPEEQLSLDFEDIVSELESDTDFEEDDDIEEFKPNLFAEELAITDFDEVLCKYAICYKRIVDFATERICAEVVYCDRSATEIEIPTEIQDGLCRLPVISIGEGAFKYCESLKNITIPQSVTRIGYGAFFWCESLESITIENAECEIDDDFAEEICNENDENDTCHFNGIIYGLENSTAQAYAVKHGKKFRHVVKFTAYP